MSPHTDLLLLITSDVSLLLIDMSNFNILISVSIQNIALSVRKEVQLYLNDRGIPFVAFTNSNNNKHTVLSLKTDGSLRWEVSFSNINF